MPTVSLHVHERIDPKTIIEAVRSRDVGARCAVPLPADQSIARSGETLRQAEWRDELLKTGIRGKNGQMILFSRIEPLSGTRWLHADAETVPNDRGADSVRAGGIAYTSPQRVVISFGPEHAPLEQRQVEMAQVFFPIADENDGWARLAKIRSVIGAMSPGGAKEYGTHIHQFVDARYF